MTGGSSAAWRCTRHGAPSNGCCTTRSKKATASAWFATGDDHKGRPGAARPGASTFGAIGGLSCYFMPELTRDALFEALRRRHHYGTTCPRIFLDLKATFDKPVTGFSEDPKLGPAKEISVTEAMMGDIVRPG